MTKSKTCRRKSQETHEANCVIKSKYINFRSLSAYFNKLQISLAFISLILFPLRHKTF